MEETIMIGSKAKKILKRMERDLIEASLNETCMQNILDEYVHELINLYYELNLQGEEAYQSIRCSKLAKRLLLAATKLRIIVEKILLSNKLTNIDISVFFFDYKSLDLTILVEFEKIFEDEELPF